MKIHSMRLAAAALFLASFCHVSQSQGAVLFDNLSDGTNGYTGVTNTSWKFQKFTTTATDHVLDEISLRLYNPDGISGGFEFQIWDDSGTGGTPGAQVGDAIYQGSASALGSGYSSLLVVPVSVVLSQETSYYFMIRGTTLQDVPGDFGTMPGILNFVASDTNTSPMYFSNDSGSSFAGPFHTNLKMSISAGGVSAVPEPAGALTLAGLLGGTAFLRRRRSAA